MTTDLTFAPATIHDIDTLVTMLADDELGQQREDTRRPLNQSYIDNFRAIEQDPNNELIIVKQHSQVVGMLQLTFIPYLTHTGSWRCLIEGVRIHKDFRGKGLGTQFFEWAINRAQQRGCSIVQLTSDKKRPDAIRFYNRLGFTASHEGFKLNL
ncbi:GNAT family N-acetyltransferase [Aliikangiella marina]|uniref:GNAT family N-acetyltransferase n=1 Tax=Aliikangiella marina TaxID=1712262 RepID=A0A545T4R9_9GAMM|nr:GNAT family N-acetyltransferase [Aliikangiella marina]TQV72221.1 GNAT family N-acetyltransferase [Aliikangiella marina]